MSLSKDVEFPMKETEGLGLLNANYKEKPGTMPVVFGLLSICLNFCA